MKYGVLTLCALGISCSIFAQISPVQDSDGKSTLFIHDGASLNFNFQDKKISWSSNIVKLKNSWNFGTQGFFKSADGSSNIFSKGKFLPEGNLGFTLSKFWSADSASNNDALHLIFFSATQGIANQKLYDSTASYDNVINKQTEFLTNFTIGYNRDNQKGFLFGLAVQGIVSNNNYSSLSDYTVQTVRYVPNASGTATKAITDEVENVKGKLSDYNGSFLDATVMADAIVWPKFLKDQIAIGGHLRGNYRTIDKPSYNMGIGIYLTKAGADAPDEKDPTAIIGGLVFESKDLGGLRNGKSFLDNCLINLVVGYTFKYGGD